MKKLSTLLLAGVVALSASMTASLVQANHGNHHAKHTHAHKTTNKSFKSDVTVKVNGMVCDFCARGLEKMFKKQKSVKNIHVDLKNKVIHIDLKTNQKLSSQTIKKIVKNNGLSLVNIKR